MPSVSGTRWLVRSVIRDGRSGKKTRKSAAEENPRNRGSRWMAYDPMLSLCWIADFASGTNRFQKTPNSLRHRWNFTGIRTVFRSRRIAFPSNQVRFFIWRIYVDWPEAFWKMVLLLNLGSVLRERRTQSSQLIESINFYQGTREWISFHLPWRVYWRVKSWVTSRKRYGNDLKRTIFSGL